MASAPEQSEPSSPMLLAHPLAGCHAKIRRAYSHSERLNEAIQSWGNSNPYAFVRELDTKAGEYVLRVKESHSPPLMDWAVVIGDILHNLRSALDHLVCVMVRQNAPDHPCIGTEFPILVDEALWERRVQGGRLAPNCGLAKLGPVDDWTLDTIKRQQPFRRGKKACEKEALWVLHKLDIIDKHRTLHIGVLYFYEPEVIFDPPGGGEVVWVKPAGPFTDGDKLLRYRLAKGMSKDQVKANIDSGLEIIFDEGSAPVVGTKVNVMLDWLFDSVVWLVDVFDQKFFGGRPPAGSKRTVFSGSGSVTTDVEGAHSNDPEAKKARWG